MFSETVSRAIVSKSRVKVRCDRATADAAIVARADIIVTRLGLKILIA
jgi:hypothetical protein